VQGVAGRSQQHDGGSEYKAMDQVSAEAQHMLVKAFIETQSASRGLSGLVLPLLLPQDQKSFCRDISSFPRNVCPHIRPSLPVYSPSCFLNPELFVNHYVYLHLSTVCRHLVMQPRTLLTQMKRRFCLLDSCVAAPGTMVFAAVLKVVRRGGQGWLCRAGGT
jgi:hypothetical protein